MLKNQKGSHIVAGLLILIVIGVMGLVGFRVLKHKPNQHRAAETTQNTSKASTNSCSKTPLTKLPADLAKLEQIAPLGNIDPPDHTLPTDHMYMTYPYETKDEQRELFAPADITIKSVAYSREIFNGQDRGGDYRIDFYPCNELKLIYGHVDVLNDKIKAAIGTPENPGAGTCNTSTQVNSTITNCGWQTNVKLSAGEFFGTANGWDLWASYTGSKGKVLDANFYHNTDAVCPLDYWTSDLQAQLYAKVLRTAEPKCGEAYQDISGTLQGGWFAHKDPEKARTHWGSHFSLTHNSVDVSIGQLAVAGTIADQFMYRFTPKHSGTINVEPSETKVGTVYCYQHEGPQRFPNGRMAGSGKMLLKMNDAKTMQAEKKTGSCGGAEALTNPTLYYR